ncbi:hypothetical protein N0V88_003708 [Collariella sp. IMI 366227]|nr:hypothetical protein N0V88_003708 [Collariella sp. IMI 366227]
MGLMFSCLDTSIVSTALVSVSIEFQNYQDIPWTVLGYLLTYMSFAVGFSKLSDVYGRKNILAIAWLLFTLGSVWCGTARRMGELIPFGALAVLGIYALWPVERRERYGTTAAIARIDFLGNTLLAAASILLVFALQQAGSFVWVWSSPIIIGSLVTAGACWLLLAVWEHHLFRRGSNSNGIQPIFPMRLFTDRVYILCLLVTLLHGLTYISLLIKLPEHLQLLHSDTALSAGLHLLPLLSTCALGSFLGGALSKGGRNFTSQTLAAGSVLQLLGMGLLLGFAWAGANSVGGGGGGDGVVGMAKLLGCTAVYGLGVGLAFAACTMLAAIRASSEDLAAAQGAVAQARVFGGAGVGGCTIVFGGW